MRKSNKHVDNIKDYLKSNTLVKFNTLKQKKLNEELAKNIFEKEKNIFLKLEALYHIKKDKYYLKLILADESLHESLRIRSLEYLKDDINLLSEIAQNNKVILNFETITIKNENSKRIIQYAKNRLRKMNSSLKFILEE